MDKKLCETTNLCEEIINSKGNLIYGELSHVIQIRVAI